MLPRLVAQVFTGCRGAIRQTFPDLPQSPLRRVKASGRSTMTPPRASFRARPDAFFRTIPAKTLIRDAQILVPLERGESCQVASSTFPWHVNEALVADPITSAAQDARHQLGPRLPYAAGRRNVILAECGRLPPGRSIISGRLRRPVPPWSAFDLRQRRYAPETRQRYRD